MGASLPYKFTVNWVEVTIHSDGAVYLRDRRIDSVQFKTILEMIEKRRLSAAVVKLDLALNPINILPPILEKLSSLKYANLSSNYLTRLLPEVGKLSNLTHLNLSFNKIATLPSEIGKLTSLTHLDLGYNKLIMLPPEIGSLYCLEHLFLFHNELTELPSEIGKLSHLIELHLNNNKLTSLTTEIGKLSCLNYLELKYNGLKRMPSEIGNLSNLKRLEVSSNNLTELPPEIGSLSCLESLYFSGNKITTLPPGIGKLSSLKSLYLNSYNLKELPSEIGKLSSLESLYLSSNNLKEMRPLGIGSLSNLKSLQIYTNLKILPPEISNLVNLLSLVTDYEPFINLIDLLSKRIGEPTTSWWFPYRNIGNYTQWTDWERYTKLVQRYKKHVDVSNKLRRTAVSLLMVIAEYDKQDDIITTPIATALRECIFKPLIVPHCKYMLNSHQNPKNITSESFTTLLIDSKSITSST